MCDISREAANDAVEWLQQHDIHHEGAISIEPVDTTISDAAQQADRAAPGDAGDALVWEQVEARAREESRPTVSFFVFMAIAAMIATAGIFLDSPILIVGAMVIGPEYGPIAAICVNGARGRGADAARALATVLAGLGVAAVAAFAATELSRFADLTPEGFVLTDRELTAFIAHPDAMAAVIAVLAGVVGMLTLTEARSGTLVGVLVSVTTIPAAANIGAAAAYQRWDQLVGAAAQLGINVAGLIVAGAVTLVLQARMTTRSAPHG